MRTTVIICSFIGVSSLFAQNPDRPEATTGSTTAPAAVSTRQIRPRVDSTNAYERIFAIVPMIGKGTMDDPVRPLHAPVPHAISASARSGILAYHFEVSDSGLLALVEFVATDRTAFKGLLADNTAQTFV
jgi:hypothetical protein